MVISRLRRRGAMAAAGLIASALAGPAIAQESRTHLSIPAQDLPSSLRALAQATGQQISFDSATIGRKKAPALDGNYTVREAVDRLLAGSGLEASWGESGVLVIRAAPKADANAAGEQGAGSGYTANEIVVRSEEHTSELQSLMRNSYAVFCLK